MNNFKDSKIYIFMMVIVSAVLQSFALSSFSVPGKFYPAGISGFSRLCSDILFDFLYINLPYYFLYFVLNIVLALITYKYIGKWFTIFSLTQISIVTVLSGFLKPMINLNEIILFAIFGGVINGMGAGLALKNNASTGGTDFVTIYFSNKYKKSLWNYTFIFNSLIIICAGLFYGWERACYSIIYQYCSTAMVKKLHDRYTQQTITIITKHPDEVSKQILANIRHGITSIQAKGVYNNDSQTILYTIVNSFQTDLVVKCVLDADKKAFINIQETVALKGNYYQKPLE